MVPLFLTTLAEWVSGSLRNATGKEVITGVSTDSRRVHPGDLFVALRGERFDGHDFIADAFQKGAVAALVHRPLDLPYPFILVPDTLSALGRLSARYLNHLFPAGPPFIVAVTGSSGKTTTKAMIGAVLSTTYPTLVAPESFNNEVGVPMTLLQATRHHRAFALEFAMRRRGDIAYLCRLAPPSVAVITNIGTAHIGLLGSRRAIAEAKAEVLNWDERKGWASFGVLPADDDFFDFLRGRAKGEVIAFGFSPMAQVRGLECRTGWDGTTLKVTDGAVTVHFRLPLLGDHNAQNALAALAVAKAVGIRWDVAVEALQKFSPPTMRLQRQWLDPPGCWVLNDAYNANPDSVKAALRVLKALPATRKVAVLGEMLELGEFHEIGHREVGEAAVSATDLLIVIGEGAKPIADGAKGKGFPTERLFFFPDLERAQRAWRDLLSPGDLVLLKASRAIGLEQLLAGR